MNVLITGAAGGFGRALAAECAQRGFDLFLTDINAPALDAIKEGITRRYDVEVRGRACDLTREGEVDALLAWAGGQGACFDMLLNVAGVDFEGGFTSRTAKQISSIIDLNIGATLDITHKILSRRPAGKRFYIVFISSLASLYPMPLKACYAASKRFLYDFAYALGNELKSSGVSITTVCPGGLATTEEATAGIAAQGIWGALTENRLEIVAQRTVAKALRGRKVYIPGLINRTLGALGKIVPRAMIAKVIFLRWDAARATRRKEISAWR